MNNNKKSSVDEIIDLTDVVSIGSGVGLQDTSQAQDDVLDSLVNEFAEKKQDSDEDNNLDLSNLDNLINSYNLDFDESNISNEQLDTDFDTILNDIKKERNEAQEETDSTMPQNDIVKKEDQSEPIENIPPFSEEDEIDLLTKDIIDGTDSIGEQNNNSNLNDSFNATSDTSSDILSSPSSINAERIEADLVDFDSDPFLNDLDKQLGEEHVNFSSQKKADVAEELEKNTKKSVHAEDMEAFSAEALNDLGSFSDTVQKKIPPVSADSAKQEAQSEDLLHSDMVAFDQAEDISDEAFNDILNELSLEHEYNEEVVPFAKDAGAETMAIKLNGDVSFIENQNSKKSPSIEDVHLVQSASKILDSDEAYLEKFDGEDESIGAKLKNLSTSLTSLEQRLNGSDSKWQDTGLQLNYRISALETRLSSLETNGKEKISALQAMVDSSIGNLSQSLEHINAKLESSNNEVDKQLVEKVSALEVRLATLDDIFSEQKMLNDELAKTLDTMQPASANTEYVQRLEDKINALQNELTEAQNKIAYLEENIENAASLAAAKVLREEIIPLLASK